MKSGITPRDFERLSAYLDGALEADKRRQLEERLRAESSLAAALKDLEGTRALLRRLPQRRAPRSFSLTPAMAGVEQRSTFGGWNSLNLVSAVATLMLVVVLAGDFWAGGFQVAAPGTEEAPQAFLAQESDMKASETPSSDLGGANGQETEELRPYAGAEDTARLADENAPFELRTFLLENRRPLELGLGLVAILTGVLAWQSRQRQINSRS